LNTRKKKTTKNIFPRKNIMMTGMMRRQNSDSPMNDNNLGLVEVFKTVFRCLSDPDGRVSHYDLVSELLSTARNLVGARAASKMINSPCWRQAGMIERLPGGYYRVKSSRRALRDSASNRIS
jgi:hypothetical protein